MIFASVAKDISYVQQIVRTCSSTTSKSNTFFLLSIWHLQLIKGTQLKLNEELVLRPL